MVEDKALGGCRLGLLRRSGYSVCVCVCVCVRRVEAGRRGFDGNGNGVHMESGERMF